MKKKKLIIIVGALVIGVGLGVLIYKLSEKHGNDNDNDNLGNVSQVAKIKSELEKDNEFYEICMPSLLLTGQRLQIQAALFRLQTDASAVHLRHSLPRT